MNRTVVYGFLLFLIIPFIFLAESIFSVIPPGNWAYFAFPWGTIKYKNKYTSKTIISINGIKKHEFKKILSESNTKYDFLKVPDTTLNALLDIEFFKGINLSEISMDIKEKELKTAILLFSTDGFTWYSLDKISGSDFDSNILFKFNSTQPIKHLRCLFSFNKKNSYLAINKLNFYFSNKPTLDILRYYFDIYNTFSDKTSTKPYVPLLNSLFLSFFVAFLNAFIFLLLSFHKYFRKSRLIDNLGIIALSMPGPIFLIPQFKFVASLGLLNTYTALVFPFLIVPITLNFALYFKNQLPFYYYEAYVLEGGRLRSFFWNIFYRLNKNTAFMVFIISFVSFFNAFLWPLMVVQTDNMKVLTLATVKSVIGQYNLSEQIKLVSQFFLIIVIMVIIIIFRKFIYSMYDERD